MNAYGRIGPGAGGRLVLAVPLVVLMAVAGIGLLSRGEDVPSVAVSSSGPSQLGFPAAPTPHLGRSTPGPVPMPALTLACAGDPVEMPLLPGRHHVLNGSQQVTLTFGQGWRLICSAPGNLVVADSSGGIIGVTTADAIPCYNRPASGGASMLARDRSDVEIDGFAFTRIELGPESACHPNQVLDALGDPGGRGRDTVLTLWVADHTTLVAYAASTPGIAQRHETLRLLVQSARISFLPGPPLPIPQEPTFPPPGELDPGPYWATVDSGATLGACCSAGFTFWFDLPSNGWASLGPGAGGMNGAISTGTPGTPGGAIIRFGNPDRVYRDPCGQALGPPLGASVSELADAMASLPGFDAQEPVVVSLRHSTGLQVVLTPRDDLGCDPRSATLWWDEVDGPRAPAGDDSRIQVWLFNPNDRPVFGRIVVEAETFAGASAQLDSEIQHIVFSIEHGG